MEGQNPVVSYYEFDDIEDINTFQYDQKLDDFEAKSTDRSSSPELSEMSRKKRPLKKAPEAPRRFKTAYICFVMERMEDVKQSMSNDTKVTDIMKILAGMWKALSPIEKQKYERQADEDKSRYFEEMKRYTGPMQVPNKRQRKPPVSWLET
jgi:hypothetical protein